MDCGRNKDCEGAKDHYVVSRSPVYIINIAAFPGCEFDAGKAPHSLAEKRAENGCGHGILPRKVYFRTKETEGNSLSR